VTKRILVVDDSPAIRSGIKMLLKQSGYTVEIAGDGEQGLQVAKEGRFDLILSDIMMPHMNGIEMIHALRKLPSYSAVPILVLTTESENELVRRALEAGARTWMIKPFAPDMLLQTVEAALEAPRGDVAAG